MGMRYQPQGRAQASALARQLGVRSLILPTGGILADLISPVPVAMSGLTRVATRAGIAFVNGGSGSASLSGAFQSQTFSRIAVITPRAMASPGTISDSMGGGVGGAQWRIDPPGELILNKSNVANVGTSSGAGIAIGKTSVVGVTYDGSKIEFFVDGRSVGSAVNAQVFLSDGVGSLFTRGADGEKINGAIAMHGEMPPQPRAVMLALTANPWQLFADPEEDDDNITSAAVGTSIAVTPASLLLSGGEVAMRVSRRVRVWPAALAVGGGDVTAIASRKLGVQPASLALTGGDTTLQAARRMPIAAADLVLQPGVVQVRASRRLTVAPVEMAVTGQAIEFAYTPAPAPGSYAIAVTPAVFTITGGEVRMRVTRRLRVELAHFALIARQVDFRDSVTGAFIDAAAVSAARTVVFAGGKRTVIFNGGTRVVEFSGGIRTVRF